MCPEYASRKRFSLNLSQNHMLPSHHQYNSANQIVGTNLVTLLIRAACVLSATTFLLVASGKAQERENRMGVALLERRRLPEKSGILPKLPIAERGLRGRYELQTIS